MTDSPQTSLWDLTEGERLRDVGMQQVIEHGDEEYKRKFAVVVDDFKRQRMRVTAEDVTARIGMPPSGSANLVGALMRANAMRCGLHKVGRIKATRSVRHANEIAVWGLE